jgi:hypothetical protein
VPLKSDGRKNTQHNRVYSERPYSGEEHQMNRPPTDAELVVWKQRFANLAKELVNVGLKQSPGMDPRGKLLVYLLKVVHADTAKDISAQQFEEFFSSIDRVRDLQELPALVQDIESLSPSFSAADLEILTDAGISAQEDSRLYTLATPGCGNLMPG